MAKFIIKGGKTLSGEVTLAGNKNSALKLMAAALIGDGITTINNVPRIRDVEVMAELIKRLGVKISGVGTNTLTIDPGGISTYELDPDLSMRIRASILLTAPLLVKFGKAILTPPGGDDIGERLLDTHFSMMQKMGVVIKRQNGRFILSWKEKKPQEIFLEEASVTATEMGLILASSVPGKTVFSDVALEPHVGDLIDFLSEMGAEIHGKETTTLSVVGAKKLKGITHKVIPDHIEGGTFAIAAAITGGHIIINDFIPEHYHMILNYFKDMGISYKILAGNRFEVLPSRLKAKRRKFQTRPWPGFPTDLMSPFIVLATQTEGTVLCHDWMYEWRMFFVDDLISMGASIFIADPHRVIVSGPSKLLADVLYSKDIRAGMSMILAALCARGTSVIRNIEMVERGYERIEERFKALGADIKKTEGDVENL